MMTKNLIRLVIVDDHVMFLAGLKTVFQEADDMQLVASVSNSESVMEILEAEPVDIVITDLSMPDVDGIALNAMIKKKHPETKTLVLSTYNNQGKINKLIKDHVDGYLLKNAAPEILLDAIHTIFSGKKYFSEEVKKKYMENIFSVKNNQLLTNREKQVLKLITEEYTTTEIATKLCISEHTVNTHRKNLLFKLNVKNTAGLVKYALQNM